MTHANFRPGSALGREGGKWCQGGSFYIVLFIQKKDLGKIWQNIYVTAGLGGVDTTK